MHIIFGLDLEGGSVPDSLEGINQMTLGPRGLLDLLELRLGLPPVLEAGTSRLLAFREALQVADEGTTRFYSQSFEVDPFGAAKVLLRWRDDLHLNGWEPGSVDKASPQRLQDLAAVDAVFGNRLNKDSEADRLARIATAIKTGASPQVTTVDLLETPAHFPLRWQQLLELLPVQAWALPLPDKPLAKAGTRLHQLQSRLLGADAATATDDASVQILQDAVLSRNADALAGRLKSIDNQSVALISRSTDQSFLNQALENLDLAAVGASNRSAHGALVQLAPILLGLHWGPFDPQAWMTFFLHPVSPLNRGLARKLASTINQTPSRTNPAMEQAMQDTLDKIEDSAQKRRVSKQINLWLHPKEFNQTANTEVLAATIQNLGKWIGKRGVGIENADERSMWLAASSAMYKLATTLESVDQINREDLSRVVADWLTGAASGQTIAAELGAPKTLSSPGHLLEPVDHVIWWQPSENSIARLPWTRVELAWLNEHQVTFPDAELRRSAAADGSLRAILNAKQSVEFFVTPNHESLNSSTPPIMVRVQAELGDDIVKQSEFLIETEPVTINRLPRRSDCWNLSSSQALTSRPTESFSSLSKFIYAPFEWVFNYKARLRSCPLFDYRIMDDARRQGSLLHGFVESLLEPELDALTTEDADKPIAELASDEANVSAGLMDTLVRRLFASTKDVAWANISRSDIEKWDEDHWHSILELQAAHYLVAGNEARRSELLYVAKTAIWELLKQLEAANITEVYCEEPINGAAFNDASIGGIVDLRVVNHEGQVGVIDLKLGGASGRREELQKGRHLQLSTYGKLVEHEHNVQAHCGYFIFSGGGILLARSNEFFKGAEVATDGREEPWQYCWQEFNGLWQHQRNRFDQGIIDFKSDPALKHWAIKEPHKYSAYLNLIGWRATD